MRSIRFVLKLVLAAAVIAASASASPIRFDMGDGPAQTGWTPVPSSTLSATNAGVSLSLTSTAAALAIGERDRGAGGNGGGAESDMWRDFFFVPTGAGEGFEATLTGLVANASYDVTVWSFDANSAPPPFGGRSALWEGQLLNFVHTDLPASLADHTVTFRVFADATGTATFFGLSQETISPGAFLNGMEIVFVPEPGLALMITAAAAIAPFARRSRSDA